MSDKPSEFNLQSLPFFTARNRDSGEVKVPVAAAAHLTRGASAAAPSATMPEDLASMSDFERDLQTAEEADSLDSTQFWTVVATLRGRAADAQARELEGRSGLSDREKEALGQQCIIQVVSEHVQEQMRSGGQRQVWSETYQSRVRQAVFDQMFRLGRYQDLIDDENVENIHIHGHDVVFAEYAGGRMVRKAPVAVSDEQLMEDLQFFANRNGEGARPFSSAHPDLDMDLLGYIRLAAVAPPIAERPSAVFRIHRYTNITLEELVGLGTLTPAMAHFLTVAVKAKKSIVISGFGGDGKTTLMRAIAAKIGPDEQIVTIEKERELHLDQLSGRRVPPFALQYRPGTGERDANGHSPGEYTLEKAMEKALRLNSQRILVGEVRGQEIVAMLQAMQTGAGTFSTTHAYDPDDCIDRLAGLGLNIYGEEYMNRQLGRHLDFVVQLAKVDLPGGKVVRKVTHIAEVLPGEGDRKVSTQDIFRLEPGEAEARFVALPSNVRLRSDLARAGLDAGRFPAGGRA
jgi:pilus assembly protein CpaF